MGKINALDIEEFAALGMGLSSAVAIGIMGFGYLGGVAVDLDRQIGEQKTVIATATKVQQDYLSQQAPDCQSALVEVMKAKPDVDAASFSSTIDKMVVCGKTAQLIAVTYFNQQSDIKAARQKEADLTSKRGGVYGDNIIPLGFVDIVGGAAIGKFAGFVAFCVACSVEDKNEARKKHNSVPEPEPEDKPKVENVGEAQKVEVEEVTQEPEGIFDNHTQSESGWQNPPSEPLQK